MNKKLLIGFLVGLVFIIAGPAQATSLTVVDTPTLIGSELLQGSYTHPQGSYQAYDTSANLAYNGIIPIVSSNIPGYNDIHTNANLNDGYYGNGSSWIGATINSWLKIDLGSNFYIDSLSFGRDRLNYFNDRDPGNFIIEVALLENNFSNGNTSNDATEYTTIFDSNTYSFSGMIDFDDTILSSFSSTEARFVKMTFDFAGVAIDEIEITGSSPVPEPATILLFGLGILGLAGVSRKKQ